MDASTRAPGYDLFKLIVAIVLLVLAILLMLFSAPQTLTAASTRLSATPTMVPVSPTSSLPAATASPVIRPPTGTSVSEPTTTPFPSSTSPPSTQTPFLPPSPTETEVADVTATPPPPPTPTATPIPAGTVTPTPGPHAASACEIAISRSHLQVGQNAAILRRLNFRSSPGIRGNWLLTNLPGTQVKVIGGPECVPYGTGAYLWWQIQLPDGRVGWSAEGSLHGSFYFMEPQ